MELFIVWLLFGIASAIVASNKGRSGLGWFLLGVLLGPFGLLFALVVSDIRKAMPEETGETIAQSGDAESRALKKKCPSTLASL